MKPILCLLLAASLAACNAAPVSDAQVAAVAKACDAAGLVLYVFNGITSYAECRKKP